VSSYQAPALSIRSIQRSIVEWSRACRLSGAWYEDTHGSPGWRAAMTRRLAHEALEELGGAA
jgi:hypothetical protein